MRKAKSFSCTYTAFNAHAQRWNLQSFPPVNLVRNSLLYSDRNLTMSDFNLHFELRTFHYALYIVFCTPHTSHCTLQMIHAGKYHTATAFPRATQLLFHCFVGRNLWGSVNLHKICELQEIPLSLLIVKKIIVLQDMCVTFVEKSFD